MKKNKLLVPVIAIGAIASAITPLACLVGCNEEKPVNHGTIPVEYLNIDENNILRGFKHGVDLEGYDTLFVPNTVKGIGIAAFFDTSVGHSSIPDSVVNLEFEKTPDPENPERYILGQLSEIEPYAFYQSPFKKVNLPWGLRKIDRFAFSESKVEECYFPSFLNYIGEQAFSNTNLFSAMFNNEFKEYEVDKDLPPWMRSWEKKIVDESCVTYVGVKAFFNCKNLIAHRVTPYMSAYQLDANVSDSRLQGPFAQYDESTSSLGISKLRIFDFTGVTYDTAEPLETEKGKGLDIFSTPDTNTEEELEEDYFILINTSLMNPQSQRTIGINDECIYLNRISNIFNGPEYVYQDFAPFSDPPPTLNKWYIASQHDWNFGIPIDERFGPMWDLPTFDLFASAAPKSFETKMQCFYNNDKSDFKTFANDVKINAELIDDEQESEGPKLSWSVRIEKIDNVMTPKLVVTALEPLEKWIGKDLCYRVTFSSKKFGCEYTYGKKYRYHHENDTGYWALSEDDNPIRIGIFN